ncbi:MAG: DNA polymerase III subunit gamma/tau [Actinobacteria bacterium]|nr:DNA polymerase III subunit gamma/tau [Actinomycetota bacterium]
MEYQALYRKYRPQRFADIVGQDHVTLTLAREVQQGKVAHAYLFAGPRGTGKTSTARIIAKALNCQDRGIDGEPCNECFSCRGITSTTSLDVIELDAASHNSVEDVREIRANVGTVASAGGSRRVYILDEAHMLSRAASNALLKTLEEPPEHAHFVLATTEPYKLPPTIRSRTQRFDFHPVGSEVLIGHLGRIGKAEGYQAAPEALSLIARHARGSVRDALGLLEQVAALGAGKVEAAGVTRALGLADTDSFSRLCRAIADQDAPAALTLVSEIAGQGADLRRYTAEALEFFRGVFLALYAPNLDEIVDEPGDLIDEWRAQARVLDSSDVLRAIDQLGDALVALREGRDERLVLELTLLRLVRPETAVDPVSLSGRLERLEDRVRLLQERGAVPVPAAKPAPEPKGPGPKAPAPEPKGPEQKAPAPEPEGPEQKAPAPAPEQKAPAPAPEPKGPEPKAPAPAPAAPAGEPEPAALEPAPEPAAEEPAATAPAEGLDLEAVDGVWPQLVSRVREEAGPRRYALFRETRPVAVEGSTLVLGIGAHLPFHLAQLQEDDRLTAVITSAAAALLGGAVVVEYRPVDGEAHPAAPGGGTAEAEEDDPEAEVPDKDQLVESGEGGIDPADLIVDMLGGEIVDD